MIEFLSGTIYYVLIYFVYSILILFTSFHLGILSRIGNSKPSVIIKTKLNSIKLIYDFKVNYWNKSYHIIKSFLASIKNSFVVPTLQLFLRLLNFISGKLDRIEYISEYHTTKGFKEAFTEISLVFRKAVMAEAQNIWSLILLLFVIFYIILTM